MGSREFRRDPIDPAVGERRERERAPNGRTQPRQKVQKYNGPFRLQESEVASAHFMDIEQVKDLIDSGTVCPDSAQAVSQYYK